MSNKTIVGNLAFLLMMLFVGGCGASDTLDSPPHVIEEPLVSTEVNSSDEIKKGPPYKDINEMFADSWWIAEEANSSVESPREPIYIHFALRFLVLKKENITEYSTGYSAGYTYMPITAVYYKINGEYVEYVQRHLSIDKDDDNRTMLKIMRDHSSGKILIFEVSDANLSSDDNVFHSFAYSNSDDSYKNLVLKKVNSVPFQAKELSYTNIVNVDIRDYAGTSWIGESSNIFEYDDTRDVDISNDNFFTRLSNVNYNIESTYRKFRDYNLRFSGLRRTDWKELYSLDSKEKAYNLQTVTQMQILQTSLSDKKRDTGEYLNENIVILRGDSLNPDTNKSENVALLLTGVQPSIINEILASKAKALKGEDGYTTIKKNIADLNSVKCKITLLPWDDYEKFASNIDIEKGIKNSELFEHPNKLFSGSGDVSLEESPRDDGSVDMYFLVHNLDTEEAKKYPIAFSFVTDFESFGKMVLVEKMVRKND